MPRDPVIEAYAKCFQLIVPVLIEQRFRPFVNTAEDKAVDVVVVEVPSICIVMIQGQTAPGG